MAGHSHHWSAGTWARTCATCSPHPAETTAVVADVLASTDGVRQLDARPLVTVGKLGPDLLGDGPHVQLWPHIHGTDAMFFAVLRKTGTLG